MLNKASVGHERLTRGCRVKKTNSLTKPSDEKYQLKGLETTQTGGCGEVAQKKFLPRPLRFAMR